MRFRLAGDEMVPSLLMLLGLPLAEDLDADSGDADGGDLDADGTCKEDLFSPEILMNPTLRDRLVGDEMAPGLLMLLGLPLTEDLDAGGEDAGGGDADGWDLDDGSFKEVLRMASGCA